MCTTALLIDDCQHTRNASFFQTANGRTQEQKREAAPPAMTKKPEKCDKYGPELTADAESRTGREGGKGGERM